ncbi:MAG: arsenate reductase ArsC [Candidatus Hodarchaeales archaeon]
MKKQLKILFLCTHNSARSIMAEALALSLAPDLIKSYSAGTKPCRVQENTIDVLKELKIDTNDLYSKSVDNFLDREFDYIITACDQAKETCPVFSRARNQLHWSSPDPSLVKGSKGDVLEAYRKVRDAIEATLMNFITNLKENKL